MRRALLAAVLLLAGCAASAQTRPAYVDVNALLRNHPLYGTLAQYDRQIAALEGTLHTGFANADAQFANASAGVANDAARVTAGYGGALRQAQGGSIPHHDSSSMPHHDSSSMPQYDSGSIERHVQEAYEQQHAGVQRGAQSGMQQYRAALSAQQQNAYNAFVDSVSERSQQAVALRAQELRDRESNLLLELARAHAPARLSLRAKLQTLVLQSSVRAGMNAQLAAIQAQEDAALAAARRADAATLRAYSAQVYARAQSDVAAMSADLQSRSVGNLAARERVLQSQTSSASALPLFTPPGPSGSIADMQTQYNALVKSRMPDGSAFNTARDDLRSNWDALRHANDDDTAHTQSQIAWLRHDRDAVRKRMVAQILYEANKIATSRGYSNVIAANAPAGAPDLTAAVRSDLASLSP